MRITLNSEDTDRRTVKKIKNSFKFEGGPLNIVGLQSNAEEYLARGGKKIFGQIQALKMKNGNLVAVQ